MRSVTIAIQSNPDISALIVGGLRLLIDVWNDYRNTP